MGPSFFFLLSPSRKLTCLELFRVSCALSQISFWISPVKTYYLDPKRPAKKKLDSSSNLRTRGEFRKVKQTKNSTCPACEVWSERFCVCHSEELFQLLRKKRYEFAILEMISFATWHRSAEKEKTDKEKKKKNRLKKKLELLHGRIA